jgi:CrcB protein
VIWVGLAVAGAIGAPARYLLDGFIQQRTQRQWPLGTLVINVSGSFLLGFLTGLLLYHAFPRDLEVVLGAGFCGSFTTFSTFTFEMARLAEEGAWRQAGAYAVLTAGVGLGAAALGLAAAGGL